MPGPDFKLTPADPSDLADAIAFALIFSGESGCMTATNSRLESQPIGSDGIWKTPDTLS
jgi:hypothetical protein